VVLAGALAVLAVSAATPAQEALAVIRQVGPEGKGNAAATAAWKRLVEDREAHPIFLLEGMNDANDLARNWLRAALETIAARDHAAGKPFPAAALVRFVEERGHDPQARWLAYTWLARVEPARAEQLVPGLLDDPSGPLRREGVARLMREAAALKNSGDVARAKTAYTQALQAAREVDQIEALAAALRDTGEAVDLDAVFGWVTRWRVIGPFDNTGLTGFDRVYPPETELRFAAEYEGKSGKVRWLEATTVPGLGKLDLNRSFGAAKEVTGYAVAEFHADQPRPAQLRLGCKNAWKVWFNGRFLFGRDEYHRGAEIDQYRLPVDLKAGPNLILVKVCQNEEVEDWTVEWEFQLRVTDALGTPIRSAGNLSPSN
jgi:hypothetical protein